MKMLVVVKMMPCVGYTSVPARLAVVVIVDAVVVIDFRWLVSLLL